MKSDCSAIARNLLTTCEVHGTEALAAIGLVTMAIDPVHGKQLSEEVRGYVTSCQRCSGLVMTGLLGLSVALLTELYAEQYPESGGEELDAFWRRLAGEITTQAYKEDG